MRFGFAAQVLGQPGLKSHDSRRWQNQPHLSVSLAYLRDTLGYLRRQNIRMYRLAAELAPYVTHPDMPWFHSQIDECAIELNAVGQMARADGLRLSFHAPITAVLNALDKATAAKAAAELNALARLLDGLDQGPEAVVILHVGGVYEDRHAARHRFVERYRALPPATCQRLALEHDDERFSVADIAWIHDQTGIPLVYDHLHHRCYNPEKLDVIEALSLCLQSWPRGVRPKVHFSSPSTAMHVVQRRHPTTNARVRVLHPPQPNEHADFVHPFEFIAFLRAAREAALPDFDVMLEVRAKDLALLRLRQDLSRFAPDLMEDLRTVPVN
jgi:UV DNA damage endonuclease